MKKKMNILGFNFFTDENDEIVLNATIKTEPSLKNWGKKFTKYGKGLRVKEKPD